MQALKQMQLWGNQRLQFKMDRSGSVRFWNASVNEKSGAMSYQH